MKKIFAAFLTLALLGALAVSALAADTSSAATGSSDVPQNGYSIEINGQDAGSKAVLMVPARAVGEKLGFRVTWQHGTVLLDDGQMHTTVTIGQDSYLVSTSIAGVIGTTAPFSLGVPPYMTGGVTYVPLELFDVLLGQGAVTVDGSTIRIQTAASSSAQIANPFQDCATLREAADAAGFSLTVPETVSGYGAPTYQVIPGELLQLRYTGADKELMIRKAVGSQDCSGDYTDYTQTETVTVNGISVTLRGENGTVSVAIWTDGGYAYALDAQEGSLTRSAALALAAAVR